MLSKKANRTKNYKHPTEYHTLYCCECEQYEFTVRVDVVKVTCGMCVQKIVAPPENYSKQNSPTAGFPRGWHFKKRFEAPNGDVYSFGKLVGDVVEDSIVEESTESKIKQEKSSKKTKTGSKRKSPLKRKRTLKS